MSLPSLIKSWLPLFSNKYILVIFVAFVWMTFFDADSLINRIHAYSDLHALEREKLYYTERIHNDSLRLEELRSSPEQLEKFAREQFFMHHADEDIFIIQQEK